MTQPSRPLATLIGLGLFAVLGTWWGGPYQPETQATPPAPPANPAPVTLYDPDPQHLWNRLHRAVWVRTGPDGKEYGQDRLDPLLWPETRHLLEGKSHAQAIAILDEFLAKNAAKLLDDPLKRAMLQRDLWAVFDWTTGPDANTQEAHLQRPPLPRRALQTRLVPIIRQLALTAEQIKGLPDNYAAAVASRAFAEKPDSDRPERPFLPLDLFQKDGPWVELHDHLTPIAPRHAQDFGARSAFRVFLRLPDGRKATLDYLTKLRNFPQTWISDLSNDTDRRIKLKINPDLPQFPVGTQAALVRQMLLIDQEGGLAATHVTGSVQFRVFRAIPKVTPQDSRRRDGPPEQDVYELALRRELLFAGKTGGLRPLGRDDKDFSTQLLVLPVDEFELQDNVPFEKRMGQPLRSCLGCHDTPGIHSFRSYTGTDFPRRLNLPSLDVENGPDWQGWVSAYNKREQYSWGLLHGLWENSPRR
jgi:hypothetical protein